MSLAENRAAARDLRLLGISLCTIDGLKRKPKYKGSVLQSVEPYDIAEGDCLGALAGVISNCGWPGHSLVPIDLDSDEAVYLADRYLPPTPMCEGRPGKRKSHRYYAIPNATIPAEWLSTCATAKELAKRYGHPGPRKTCSNHRDTGERVLDFHGTGLPIVVPPSPHEAGRRTWDTPDGRPRSPAIVPFPELLNVTSELAVAAGGRPLGAKGARAIRRPRNPVTLPPRRRAPTI